MTITILAILAGVGAHMLGGGFNAFLTARALSPLSLQAALAMERMVRELRWATYWEPLDPNPNNMIQFTKKQGQQIEFSQSPSPPYAIHMTVDGGPAKPLVQKAAQNTLQFGLSGTLFTISFTLNNTLADGSEILFPLRTAVAVQDQTP